MSTRGFASRDGDSAANVVNLPEHATAGSFVAGDLVNVAGGKVRILQSDQNIFGIALGKASGTADTDIPVEVISPDKVYVAQADTTTAVTQVNNDYGLNIGTAGNMSVDIGDTSTTSVVVVDLDPRDAVGTNGGRLLVKFTTAALDTATP